MKPIVSFRRIPACLLVALLALALAGDPSAWAGGKRKSGGNGHAMTHFIEKSTKAFVKMLEANFTALLQGTVTTADLQKQILDPNSSNPASVTQTNTGTHASVPAQIQPPPKSAILLVTHKQPARPLTKEEMEWWKNWQERHPNEKKEDTVSTASSIPAQVAPPTEKKVITDPEWWKKVGERDQSTSQSSHVEPPAAQVVVTTAPSKKEPALQQKEKEKEIIVQAPEPPKPIVIPSIKVPVVAGTAPIDWSKAHASGGARNAKAVARWKLQESGVQKDGNASTDYEDASSSAPENGLFAISDGATEGSFSNIWANLLVKGFTKNPPKDANDLLAWLAPHQAEFRQRAVTNIEKIQSSFRERLIRALVPQIARKRDVSLEEATKVAQEMAEKEAETRLWSLDGTADEGTFASILGVSVKPKGDHMTVHAIAAGDSVLFRVAGGKLSLAWPVEKAADFDNSPILLSTDKSQNRLETVKTIDIAAQPNERFFLATDALAKWILTEVEAGRSPWDLLWRLKSPAALKSFITQERAAHRMRNDDVTLLSFAIPENSH